MATEKDYSRYAENYQNLVGQGVDATWLNQNYGQNIENKARGTISNAWNAQKGTFQQQATGNIPTLNDLAGQTYQFDPNKYLPGIQQTADSIYNPQQAQLEALRQLQTSQTEQARIRTQEDFAKEMESTVERINARGGFFGGGALKQEGDVMKRQNYALTDLNLQDQAAQAGMLAQKAGLSAAQAQYVQEQLSGQNNSEYSRFTDNRNFLLNLTQEQRRQLENDRDFQENIRQFGLNYALDKKRLKQSSKSSNK